MGEETKYFLICKLWYLQAADPWLWLAGLAVCTEREGVPLPRSGGGWEGADVSQTPYKARLRAVRKAFFAEKRLSYPAQQGERKGFVKGESVPLDRVLVPFTRVKGTLRRRAVLTKLSKRLAPPKTSRNDDEARFAGDGDSEPSAAGGG